MIDIKLMLFLTLTLLACVYWAMNSDGTSRTFAIFFCVVIGVNLLLVMGIFGTSNLARFFIK